MVYRYLLIIIGILLIVLYTAPLIETKLNFGNIFGIGVGLALILASILFNLIKKVLILKIALIVFSICIFAFFIVLFYIIFKSKRTATNQETIIVLGCRVFGDRPSLSLIQRCNVAINHLNSNPSCVAILSGGQGADELISEAECMKKLLIKGGIDESRIFIESQSTTTDENIMFSKKIIEQNGLSSQVAIATSDYHIARALIIAKRHGFAASSLPSNTLNRVKAPFFTREVFGLVKAILLKR